MHYILCIVFFALNCMHCIPCIIFYALNFIHNILCLVFSAFYSMHSMYVSLTLKLVVEELKYRPTDQLTDIVKYYHS